MPRFEKRIYIPLPDVHARARLFQLEIGELPSQLTPQDFKRLAEMTEGYSGSDISIVVRDAILEPVRKVNTATHYKLVTTADGSEKWMPCSPGDDGAIEKTWQEIEPAILIEPPLTVNDFLRSVKTGRPTLSQTDIDKHIEFTKNFGQEG